MIDERIFEKKYAELALQTGVNLQKGQGLLIQAPIEAVEFVRIVVKQAYEMGAKKMHTEWSDDQLTLLKMTHAPMEVLETFPEWRKEAMISMVKDGYAVLNIYGENPDLLQDIDGKRMAAVTKARSNALKEYREYMMNDRARWSIVGYPTLEWAQKKFSQTIQQKQQRKSFGMKSFALLEWIRMIQSRRGSSIMQFLKKSSRISK